MTATARGLRAAYRGTTAVLEVGAPAWLRWRLRHGKEEGARLAERRGIASAPRPAGPLVWLHGASVGESLALLPLVARFRAAEMAVLVTTGTVSSARLMAARLPAGARHQYLPLDGPRAARRFLDHWRPDLVLFAESELWPNLLDAARRRGTPTALVNARMSARSFARWRRLPELARSLIGGLDLVLAQSSGDADRFAALGGRTVATTGNLKFDAVPPPADPAALAALQRAVAGRPVWVAASTHAGEDLACCGVHAVLRSRFPGLLTILVPRRVERASALLEEAAHLGFRAAARSRGDALDAGTEIYVADTMGEIGLFYRLDTVVFVGKSLPPATGGQNPIEPAGLGNAVLHGPNVDNFVDVYGLLEAAGGTRRVADQAALADGVAMLLHDADARRAAEAEGRRAVAAAGGATDRTVAALSGLLPCVQAAWRG